MSNKDSGIVMIHGKAYKTVAKRVEEFRKEYPTFYLTSEIVQLDADQCVVKAYIGEHNKDGTSSVYATGHAQEFKNSSFINKTSYVEVCESSAWGRALANFGYAGSELASADEVANAIANQNVKAKVEAAVDGKDFL